MDSNTDCCDIYGGKGADIIKCSSNHLCRVFGGEDVDLVTGDADDFMIDYRKAAEGTQPYMGMDTIAGCKKLEEVFGWRKGDIFGSDWHDEIGSHEANGYVQTLANGDKRPVTQQLHYAPGGIRVGVNNIIPDITNDEQFVFFVRNGAYPYQHNQIRPDGGTWLPGGQNLYQKRYRVELEFTLPKKYVQATNSGDVDYLNVLGTGFINIFQSHKPGPGPNNTGPSIQLLVHELGGTDKIYGNFRGDTGSDDIYDHSVLLAAQEFNATQAQDYRLNVEFTRDKAGPSGQRRSVFCQAA